MGDEEGMSYIFSVLALQKSTVEKKKPEVLTGWPNILAAKRFCACYAPPASEIMTKLRTTWITAVTVALAVAACSATSNTVDDDGAGAGSSGTSNDSSSGALGTGGGPDNWDGCGEASYGNEVPGTILIVLDRSGSMSDDNKWGATVAAINSMITSAAGDMNIGLLPFPLGAYKDQALLPLCMLNPASNPNCPQILADGGCSDVGTVADVPIAPINQSGGPIASWLNQNNPNGNTPTLYAIKNGVQIVRDYPAEGPRYLLLLTDGIPTTHTPALFTFPEMFTLCGDLAAIEAEVAAGAAGSPAVNTFVIGSPGSEGAGEFLSQLAVNGNTPKSSNCSPAAGDCHYQIGTANFQQELEAVLDQIAGTISNCVFDLPAGEEIDPNMVNVVIETANGKVEVFRDLSHLDGWDYTDSSQTQVQLFGPPCELYKQEKGNKVIIVLGCKTKLK